MSEFFAMGGYAVYVWSAWGLTVIVMTLNLILPLRQFRKLRREQEK
ncbi:MAG: heme exporter protein CcmD [Gammaproteobacteria bacterium]